METHCQFARSEGFWRSQGFEPCGVVEVVGHRGGIWVMARINRDFGVSVIEQEAQALTFNISKGVLVGHALRSMPAQLLLLEHPSGRTFKICGLESLTLG